MYFLHFNKKVAGQKLFLYISINDDKKMLQQLKKISCLLRTVQYHHFEDMTSDNIATSLESYQSSNDEICSLKFDIYR